ncbi:MAG: hypothetical protein RLZZ479_880, partial [Bacteroidota bacterium]
RDVSKLQQFLILKNLDYRPTEVTSEVIADLMQYLESLGLEATSQARTLSGLKTFYRFLLLEDIMDTAPTDLIERPKLGRKIPDFLTVEEVERIFEAIDLVAERLKVEHLIPTEVQEYFYNQKIDLYEMQYPVLEYPSKVTSLSLDKTPNFQGKLMGIKGQYLLFEGGTVFNIRSSEGYVVKIEI